MERLPKLQRQWGVSELAYCTADYDVLIVTLAERLACSDFGDQWNEVYHSFSKLLSEKLFASESSSCGSKFS